MIAASMGTPLASVRAVEHAPNFGSLSRETGIHSLTLRSRWQAGDRGERLIRPPKVTGRRIAVEKQVRSARDLLRRYIKARGLRIIDLAEPWNMKVKTIEFHFYHRRRPHLEPWQIDAAADFLKLNQAQRTELHLFAARDMGWKV
jgi:hypothetical protein